MDMIFTYYEQGINEYCAIVNNNLEIFNKIKEKYQNEIECFIKDNLKDKYDISFGHYGSYYTGLQIEGSDMDIFILYKSKEDNNNILSFRNELYYLIRKNKPLYGAFKLPDDVIPPLVILNIDIYDEIIRTTVNEFNYINFEEKEKLKIDLTFNNNEEYLHINEKNVNYVKNAINEYPEIKPVILVLKRYFKNINMNKVFRG
jgi:DNA polymerase sigma